MLKFGSLFSGIGGLDLGLERAGMECVWQVEIDDYATRVLEKHWPGVPRWRDVRTFPPAAGQWQCDLICGGDPCQRNSAAGGGKSRATSLGDQFIRVVNVLRPRIVLRENPSHILSDAPWPWWRFRLSLESLGYVVLPFRLRACCAGAQHRRERLFLFAELAYSNRDGLEGWHHKEASQEQQKVVSPRVETSNWKDIPICGGHDSRAGLPTYVDEIRGLGNAVVPQVAEWIGQRIIECISSRES